MRIQIGNILLMFTCLLFVGCGGKGEISTGNGVATELSRTESTVTTKTGEKIYLTYTESGIVGSPIILVAKIRNENNRPLPGTVHWGDNSDSRTLDGTRLQHTYSSPGVYRFAVQPDGGAKVVGGEIRIIPSTKSAEEPVLNSIPPTSLPLSLILRNPNRGELLVNRETKSATFSTFMILHSFCSRNEVTVRQVNNPSTQTIDLHFVSLFVGVSVPEYQGADNDGCADATSHGKADVQIDLSGLNGSHTLNIIVNPEEFDSSDIAKDRAQLSSDGFTLAPVKVLYL